jgi:hypothetical protein
MAPAPAPATAAEAVPEAKRTKAPESDQKAAASVARMTALLERELVLMAPQREALEQVLKDRDAEIKSCHAAMVRSGVIDIAHYEWQVDLMKEGWYRKVDALLDRAQHERFRILVQQGIFNEGLAFTVQPGMMVLD